MGQREAREQRSQPGIPLAGSGRIGKLCCPAKDLPSCGRGNCTRIGGLERLCGLCVLFASQQHQEAGQTAEKPTCDKQLQVAHCA